MNRFIALVILITFLVLNTNMEAQNFKNQQQQFERVRAAYTAKEVLLKKLVTEKGGKSLANEIIIVGYKKEKELEVWFKPEKSGAFKLLVTYPFCSTSGELGPKRQGGDGQIPEGFYTIQHFNPVSNFYLSLGVSYPNQSDRILGTKGNLGGDIYIHGNCVTIGCIPITDDKIMELYVLAVEAKNAGQQSIPVYIFPARLTDENLKQISDEKKECADFWKNLKTGYDKFTTKPGVLKFTIDKTGKYIFK